MKAVWYDGTKPVIKEVLLPVPGPTESLIRILMAGICNTDKEVIKGYRPEFRGILGHEFIGIVEQSFEPALSLLVKLPPIDLYPLEQFEEAFQARTFKAGFLIGKEKEE